MQATRRVKDPRKQRRLLHTAPAHLRHKLMSASLSPQLVASKSVKTLPVRRGDTVRILRGDSKGFEGKISRIDLKNYRIYLEGLTREKVDGTTIFIPVHPSKVMIKNLNLSDKWRKAIVDRKEELHKKEAKEEKVAEKPTKEATKVKREAKKAAEETTVKAKRKVIEARVVAEETPEESKPYARPTTAPVKLQQKLVRKKKKEAAPSEEDLTAKENKPKAPKGVKKTPTKRKTVSEKKGGGK